jgi:hypothetical protein
VAAEPEIIITIFREGFASCMVLRSQLGDLMNRYTPSSAIAAIGFTAIFLMPASAKTPSQKDAKTFQSCMLMKAEEAFQNTSCRAVMRKLRVTKSDLVKMKSCESQTSATENNNDCAEMAEKHPELAHGHGRDDDAESGH